MTGSPARSSRSSATTDIVMGVRAMSSYDQAAQRLSLDDFQFGIKDMGSLAVSGAVTGLPVAAFDDERLLQSVLPQLKLEAASVTFKDNSIVGKGLDLLAEYMHAPAGDFPQPVCRCDALPAVDRRAERPAI